MLVMMYYDVQVLAGYRRKSFRSVAVLINGERAREFAFRLDVAFALLDMSRRVRVVLINPVESAKCGEVVGEAAGAAVVGEDRVCSESGGASA